MIDIESAAIPTAYGNDTPVTIGGVDFLFHQTACFNAGVIQMKKQVSYVANATAFEKPIISVTILGGGAAGSFYATNYKCFGGPAVKPAEDITGEAVENGTKYDFSGKGYTFFMLTDPSNYAGKLVKISIVNSAITDGVTTIRSAEESSFSKVLSPSSRSIITPVSGRTDLISNSPG